MNAYGLRLLAKPRVRIAALGLLALVVVGFRALQFAALTRQIQWGYDFSAYWAAAKHLLAGESPYTAAQLAGAYAPQVQFLYLYPPPLAAAVAPLTLVVPDDYRAAAWVWAAVGAAVLAASVLALHRSERLGERYPILAGRGKWLLLAAAFSFPPVVGELVLGNVHLLLLGLLTLAWLGVRRAAPRDGLIAGIAVGVATVVKVFPAIVLLWFLLTRRWRAAAGVFVGIAAVIALALPLTGLESWSQFPSVLANLSFSSDTTDTLAPTVWLAPALGFTVARLVVTAIGIAILAWAAMARPSTSSAARIHATRITDRNGTRGPETGIRSDARTFAIAVTVSILVAPALYHHYLALLVLPFILGLGAGVPLRWLALAYFLMWGGTQPALGDLSWIVNRLAPTAGALVLLAALLLAPRLPAPRRPDSVLGGPTPDQSGVAAQTLG